MSIHSNPINVDSTIGHPLVSPLTPSADLVSVSDPMATIILATTHENATYTDLQEKLIGVEGDLHIIMEKITATKAVRNARLTVLTGTNDTKLRAQHNDENMTLRNAHKAALEQLKIKQAAEGRVLYKKHMEEFKVARQEHAEANSEFQQMEATLFKERSAKLQEKEKLDTEVECELRDMVANSGWYAAVNKVVRDQMKAKRTKTGSNAIDGENEYERGIGLPTWLSIRIDIMVTFSVADKHQDWRDLPRLVVHTLRRTVYVNG
jgi:hypothetical protein